MTSQPGRNAAALERLADRLRVVVPRRLPALWTLLVVAGSSLLLSAMLVADRRGRRWAMRVGRARRPVGAVGRAADRGAAPVAPGSSCCWSRR